MDRRQRLLGDRDRRRSRSNERRRRMRRSPLRVVRRRRWRACVGRRRRDPARRAPLRLRLHEPRDAARCRTTTPPIPACCGCSTARRCGTRKAGAAGQVLRRLPRRRARQHEGRRRALSGLRRRRAAGRSISSSASTSAAPSSSRRRRSPSRARSCWRSPPMSARQSRGMPIDDRDDARTQPFLDAGRDTLRPAPGPAQPLLRAVPRRQLGPASSPAAPIPQAHPTGYPLYRLEWQSARLAAAAAAQLPDRHARRALRARRARIRRSRALPDVARARHAGRDAGRAAVSRRASLPHCGVRWKPSSGVGPHTLVCARRPTAWAAAACRGATAAARNSRAPRPSSGRARRRTRPPARSGLR